MVRHESGKKRGISKMLQYTTHELDLNVSTRQVSRDNSSQDEAKTDMYRTDVRISCLHV